MLKIYNISNGISKEISVNLLEKIKELYYKFLGDNSTVQDKIKDLNSGVSIYRIRILVVKFSGFSKKNARNFTGIKCFSILEWKKSNAFSTLNSLVYDPLEFSVFDLLKVLVVGLKVLRIQQLILRECVIMDIIRENNISYGDIKDCLFMYVKIPPENTELRTLVNIELQDRVLGILNQLSFKKHTSSIQQVRGYMEWKVDFKDLENQMKKTVSHEEWEIYSTQNLSKYLEWKSLNEESVNVSLVDSPKSVKSPRKRVLKEENLKGKKKRHCRCCGSNDCSGRGGVKYCFCFNPKCLRILEPKAQ